MIESSEYEQLFANWESDFLCIFHDWKMADNFVVFF